MSAQKVKQTQVEDGTRDLIHHFIAPDRRFQSRRSFSASEAKGSIKLGWYRGHHSGIYDASRVIKEQFPQAAEALLEHFNMNEDGSIPRKKTEAAHD